MPILSTVMGTKFQLLQSFNVALLLMENWLSLNFAYCYVLKNLSTVSHMIEVIKSNFMNLTILSQIAKLKSMIA